MVFLPASHFQYICYSKLFFEGKLQHKYCSSHSSLFPYTNTEQAVQEVEFLSWCKQNGSNKYGYSLGPLNGSQIAQIMNCLRWNHRKFNLPLLLLQLTCRSSKEHLIYNNRSGKSSSKKNWRGFKELEEGGFPYPQARAPLASPKMNLAWTRLIHDTLSL